MVQTGKWTRLKIIQQKVLVIILVQSEGSCLSSETNHARNSVQNVIFVFSKYHVMSFLCHHTAKHMSAPFCA